MIPECETCGRVRVDGAWVYLERVVADVVGECVGCLQRRKRAEVRRQREESEQLLANRARGYGGPAEGEDVFRGMREEG